MRSCCHQSLCPGINNSAESLQRMRSQKIQVAALRENDFVHGFELVNSKNRIANITRYDLAIPHLRIPHRACGLSTPTADNVSLGSQVNSEPVSTISCSMT